EAPKVSDGWHVVGKADLTLDPSAHGGKQALHASVAGGFGGVGQEIDATPYRGKMIRVRAWARNEAGEEDGGRGALGLRADRPGGAQGLFDNMDDRPIVEKEWRRYEIVGVVDDDATDLAIGMFEKNKGDAWFDDATIEILGDPPAIDPPLPLKPQG